MKYTLRRIDGWQPAYVRGGGHKSSYTNKISLANTYDSKEQAEAEACGNEYPVIKKEN